MKQPKLPDSDNLPFSRKCFQKVSDRKYTIASKDSDHSDQTGKSFRCAHKDTNREYLASNAVSCEESQNFVGSIPKAGVASFAMYGANYLSSFHFLNA